MKRARQEDVPTTTTLCRDLATYIHADLAGLHFVDLGTLLAWHRTCYAFYREWRRADYLLALLERARALAQVMLSLHQNAAVWLARAVTLDCCLLAVRLGESLLSAAQFNAQWACTSLTTLPETLYSLPGRLVRHVTDQLDYEGLKHVEGTEDLPVRLNQALHRATRYVRQRHGWCFALRRQITRGGGFAKKTEYQDVAADGRAQFGDELMVRLAPELYK